MQWPLNRLRVARAEARMSQQALASAAALPGLTQTRISLIENGHAQPSDQEKIRLAKVLRVEVATVFPETAAEEARS